MTTFTTSFPPVRKNRASLADSPERKKSILKSESHKYALKSYRGRDILKDTSNIAGDRLTFRPDNRTDTHRLAPDEAAHREYQKPSVFKGRQYVGKRGNRRPTNRIVGTHKRSPSACVGRRNGIGSIGRKWTRLGRNVEVQNTNYNAGNDDVIVTRATVSIRSAKRDVSGSGGSKRGRQMTGRGRGSGGIVGSATGSTDFYDTDFESDSSEECNDGGLQAYRTGCQVLGVAPLPRAINQWTSPNMNLNYRNLGPSGAKALTSALLQNPHVQNLELEENRLGGIGGMYVCTYLKDNVFITHLNLSRNNLGSMGAMAVGELMKSNQTLEFLDLSDNNFRDGDSEYIAGGIEAAYRLTTLNLSHNGFCEEGATLIGRAIGKNDSLENLSMSWNQLRRKGAGSICAGVKRNTNMTRANIAWNGLGYEGSVALSEMLCDNIYLLELDVTSNRINWEGARLVARGLAHNTYLQILRLGKNPLTTTGCYDVVHAVENNTESQLELLDLTDIPVNKAIVLAYGVINGSRKFSMPHGGLLESDDVIGKRPDIKKDPIQQLMDFITQRGIRPVDLFRQLKQDDKKMVTKEAFLAGLLNAKIPMQPHEIEEVLERIEYNEEGKISFDLLMKGVKEQIRVNREEEKRRLEMEDRFNEEKRRLMTLTPPDNKANKKKVFRRKRKTREEESQEVMQTTPSGSDSDLQESEDDLECSQGLEDSRPVTPLPVMTIEMKRTPRVKKKASLPGISDTNPLLSKSQRHLSMTNTVSKMKTIQGNMGSRGRGLKRQENLEKKPQRLMPLSDWRSLPPQDEGEESVVPPIGRSLDSWQSFAPPASTLPSAQFSLSLNLTNNGKKQSLRPLEETGTNGKERKTRGKTKNRTQTN